MMKIIYYLCNRIDGVDLPPKGKPELLSDYFFCSGLNKTGKMKEIILNKWGINKGAFRAMVDDDDYDYLNQFQWNAKKTTSNVYAVRATFVCGKQKNIKMHREIMHTPIGMEVDHIDHNGLNNQKSNLRNCTEAQNKRNAKVRSKIGYLGVTKHIEDKKYFAQIKVNGETIYLGCHETPKIAAMNRDRASIKYFGEFANLNFPELREQYMGEIE